MISPCVRNCRFGFFIFGEGIVGTPQYKLLCPEQSPLVGESILGVPNPSFFVRSSRPWRGNPFWESQIQAFCPEQSPLTGESIFGVPNPSFLSGAVAPGGGIHFWSPKSKLFIRSSRPCRGNPFWESQIRAFRVS